MSVNSLEKKLILTAYTHDSSGSANATTNSNNANNSKLSVVPPPVRDTGNGSSSAAENRRYGSIFSPGWDVEEGSNKPGCVSSNNNKIGGFSPPVPCSSSKYLLRI